ncbi:MAG TPA: hypothetical protein VIJ78_02870 [Pseudolabrys sp.]
MANRLGSAGVLKTIVEVIARPIGLAWRDAGVMLAQARGPSILIS